MLLVKTRVSPVILIEIDASRHCFHRLRHRLTRIGSDPRSTLFLPESIAERSMAVLEWDEGVVRIHNRSGYKFRLGETVIPANASAEWPDRQVLSINDRVKMTLALNPGERSAAERSSAEPIRLEDPPAQADSASPLTLSLAALLAGLVAISLTMSSKDEHRAMASALEPLILAADEPGPHRAIRREITARIQIAQRHRLRTGKEERQTWAELRDFVKTLESESGRLPDRWFEDLRSLVLKRLASSG